MESLFGCFLKTFLVVAMLLACGLTQARTPLAIAREVEQEILSDSPEMTYTKKVIDQGMNRAIAIAYAALNERHEVQLADELYFTWKMTYNRTLFSSSKDIGDHAGIFQWINTIYRRIELILGRDFCVNSHIAAMLTFNSANVVVHPCSFPMDSVGGERIDEYRRHFAGKSPISDSNYNGVIPEAVYFAVEIGCLAGTSGVGSFLCSAAASIGEKLIAMFIAPRLSDRIYLKRCEQKEIGDF